jgi:hypothetical protein
MNYFSNPLSTSPSDQCILCTIQNCGQCISLTACGACNIGYVVNPIDDLCMHCPIPHCAECFNATECALCDEANNYFENTDINSAAECLPC